MRTTKKLLVGQVEAQGMLSLAEDDFEWLVRTEQLLPIYLRGQRLFEVSELEELVKLYRTVQSRGGRSEQTDSA